uniref:Uncharacterized protein n=1 Tax=Glossina palpalis gambiensis TaxID=67801 RepID=A0A1B0ARR8_9MUSC
MAMSSMCCMVTMLGSGSETKCTLLQSISSASLPTYSQDNGSAIKLLRREHSAHVSNAIEFALQSTQTGENSAHECRNASHASELNKPGLPNQTVLLINTDRCEMQFCWSSVGHHIAVQSAVIDAGRMRREISIFADSVASNQTIEYLRTLPAVQQQSQQQALLNKSNDDLRRKRPETTRPNHILLFTIINPFYPITVNKPPIPRCVRQTQKGMN